MWGVLGGALHAFFVGMRVQRHSARSCHAVQHVRVLGSLECECARGTLPSWYVRASMLMIEGGATPRGMLPSRQVVCV